ncbi:hypothetical protein K443DRAFT_419871 [Laccaria amethystina LaAM-08-1]|uniref:Unplaced genomic scaffold K443scaffold_345, whole genome shotgun sequence n=1 Tax=Laccaria amethystina LaAM-08-1 TaxID=1095629 RepID=A0A0C9WVQ1_9AGAR|nr:hypothetical protein K443DRAFT_419871 [Laccaria amethystina LaAM-08-1]
MSGCSTEQIDHEREHEGKTLTRLKVDQRRGRKFTETRGVDGDEDLTEIRCSVLSSIFGRGATETP